MFRKLLVVILVIGAVVLGFIYFGSDKADFESFAALHKKHDVRILRDTWGVPHVFGKTDADVAFGLAYAHCEDDFETIQGVLLAARGQLASVYGEEAAPNDYMVHLLRNWDAVEAKYESDLSREAQALCQAYAEGINYYAALYSDEALSELFPTTGKDIVAGFMHKTPFFFNLDGALRKLFRENHRYEVSTRASTQSQADDFEESELGSNTFCVGPSRSANGETMLAVNSHQPWEGPSTWYEVHLRSEEGWDMVGGLFPGSPMVLHGHNRNLGWAHTVNKPDILDIYVLKTNPENPYQYRFDGEWRNLEVRTAPIKVKLFGPISWTFEREVLWSIHGPVVRQPHGTYAIRFASYGDVRQIEQWYRMNKAQNFDEWQEAMSMGSVPMFNTGYADREGNIYYLYNAVLPQRSEAYDWTKYLPGDTSETLWTEYVPFERLPQIKNPASGFIQNCNSSPFQTTIGGDNPNPENYSPTFGIDKNMTNRALRALELFGSDDSITEEEFYAYKYDMAYSKESGIAKLVQRILQAPEPDDPLMREAIAVLRDWNLQTNPDNTEAALPIWAFHRLLRRSVKDVSIFDLMEKLKEAAFTIKEKHGRLRVPWKEVNRLIRGKVNLGVGGGPDILHAVNGKILEDGRMKGLAGDSYVLLATWGKNGDVHSRSIHQYGSATKDESSPHYADQSHLFVKRKLKPVWMNEADIRANLKKEYRPGEELR